MITNTTVQKYLLEKFIKHQNQIQIQCKKKFFDPKHTCLLLYGINKYYYYIYILQYE